MATWKKLVQFNSDDSISWGSGSSANANTAYTYSQVGHLPLAGGTLTGNLIRDKITIDTDHVLFSRNGSYAASRAWRWRVDDSAWGNFDLKRSNGEDNTIDTLVLSFNNSGNATFGGSVTTGGNLVIAPNSNTPYILGGKVSTIFRNNANSSSLITILDNGNTTFAGETVFEGNMNVAQDIFHNGDNDTTIRFTSDQIAIITGNATRLTVNNSAFTVTPNATFSGSITSNSNIIARMAAAGSGIRSIVDRVDTSDYAGFEVQTGGSQRWFIGAREDSTDNLQFFNGNSSGTVQNVLSLNHSNSSATFAGSITIPEYIYHSGDTDTFIRFIDGGIAFSCDNTTPLVLDATGGTGMAVGGDATFAGDVSTAKSLKFSDAVGSTSDFSVSKYTDGNDSYLNLKGDSQSEIRIEGDLIVTGSIPSLGATTFTGDITISDGDPVITLKNTSSHANNRWWAIHNGASGDGYGELAFHKNDSDGGGITSTQVFKLDKDSKATFTGDVAVSSSDPTITIKRSNNSAFAGHIDFTNNADTLGWQVGTNQVTGDGFEVNYGASNKFYVTTGGNATFAGTITNTGLHTINQTADDDGIKLTGYDDVNNRHGWIGITSIGYTQIFAQGDRSIDLKSGRQIRFFTSTDNSTYNNSVNFNSDGSATFTGTITQNGNAVIDASIYESSNTNRRLKLTGSGDNYVLVGSHDDNGWGYLESINNANGIYYGTNQGDHVFDEGNVRPYTDNEPELGTSSYRWKEVHNAGWFRQYGSAGMYWATHDMHHYAVGTGTIRYYGGGSNTLEIELLTSGGTKRGSLYADNSDQVGLLDKGGSWAYRIVNDGSHFWCTNDNTTRMTLNNAGTLIATGDVYVGGDSRGSLRAYGSHSMSLHSVAYISLDWDANYDSYTNHGIASTNHDGTFTDSLSINSYNDINLRLDSNNNNNASYFRIHNNSTGDSPGMYTGYDGARWITSFDGKVGIATGADASYALKVNGHTYVANDLTAGGNFIIAADSTGSDQRVKLGASADLQLWHNATDSVVANFNTGKMYLWNYNDGDTVIGAWDNAEITVGDGLTTFDGAATFGGNVTIASGKKLVISTSDGANYLGWLAEFKNLDSTNNQSNGVLIQAGAGASDKSLAVRDYAGNEVFTVYGNDNAKFAGNVGIGCDPSTGYPLMVQKADRYLISINNSNASNYWWLAMDNDGEFVLHCNGEGDRFTLLQNGNATFAGRVNVNNGMYIDAPKGQNNISGDDSVFYVRKRDNNDWCIVADAIYDDSTTYGIYVKDEGTHAIYINNGTSETFRVQGSDGKVKVGIWDAGAITSSGIIKSQPASGTDATLHLDASGTGNAQVWIDAGTSTRHPELSFRHDGSNYWTVKSDPDRSNDFCLRDDQNSATIQLRIAQSTGDATFAGAVQVGASTAYGNTTEVLTLKNASTGGTKIAFWNNQGSNARSEIHNNVVDASSGSYNDSQLLFKTSWDDTLSTVLTLAHDKSATFAGDVTMGGTGASSVLEIGSGTGSSTTGVSTLYFRSKDEHGGNTHQSYIKSTIDGSSSVSTTKMIFQNRNSSGSVVDVLTLHSPNATFAGKVGMGNAGITSSFEFPLNIDINSSTTQQCGLEIRQHTSGNDARLRFKNADSKYTRVGMSSNGDFFIEPFDGAYNKRFTMDNDGKTTITSSIPTGLTVDVGLPSSANREIARFTAGSARPIAFGWIDSGSKMSLYTPDDHSLVLGTGALGTNNLEINAAGDTTFSGAIASNGHSPSSLYGLTTKTTGGDGSWAIRAINNSSSGYQGGGAYLNADGVGMTIGYGAYVASSGASTNWALFAGAGNVKITNNLEGNTATFAGSVKTTNIGIGKDADASYLIDAESSGNVNLRLRATSANAGARIHMMSGKSDSTYIGFDDEDGTDLASIYTYGSAHGAAKELRFHTGGTSLALTLDASQNATVAGGFTAGYMNNMKFQSDVGADYWGIMKADHNNDSSSTDISFNAKGDITFHIDTDNNVSNNYFRIKANTNGGGASAFWVRSDGQVSCLGVTETSSMVYKKNITKIENPLDKIEKLRGIEFDYIDSNEHSIGMVAEEVAEIFPELVIKDDTGKVSAMSYTRMTAVLLEAVKELNKKLINNNN